MRATEKRFSIMDKGWHQRSLDARLFTPLKWSSSFLVQLKFKSQVHSNWSRRRRTTCYFIHVVSNKFFQRIHFTLYLLNDSLQKVIICVVQPSPQMDNRTIWRPSWITKLLIEMSQCNSYIKNWWYITIYWKCHSFCFQKWI